MACVRNHTMKDQEPADPLAISVVEKSMNLSLSPGTFETFGQQPSDINEQYEQSSASLPYSIVRVKHKSIRTILRSIDRVSILFGVQYMFMSDGCDEIGSQSDEQTVLMYFQPIKPTQAALSDNKIEDLSKTLQVRFDHSIRKIEIRNPLSAREYASY